MHAAVRKELDGLRAGLGGIGAALGGYYSIRTLGPVVGLRGLDIIGVALSAYGCLMGLAIVHSPTE